MSTKDNGGAAFPSPGVVMENGRQQGAYEGMALRDWMAGNALQGFCANPAVFAENGRTGWGLVNASEDQLSEYCYDIADKMIAARGDK